MTRSLALTAALALAACVTPAQSDDMITGTWHLIGLEGQTLSWSASLSLDGDRISGQAPCNSYFGKNTATPPAVAIDRIASTKRACPDMAAETVYFQALAAMQRAEVDQGHLFLIGPEGRVMEFGRDPNAGEPCLSCLAVQ